MRLTRLRRFVSVRRADESRTATPLQWVESLEQRVFLSVTTTEALSSVSVAVGQVTSLHLNDFFSNPGVDGNTVFMNTNYGTIPVELTPSITPLTVANFLTYVDGGAYDDTFVHRSVPGFVWQAGGYTYDEDNGIQQISTNPPVTNEYSQPNVRGTIALAKTDGDPNSGTSQFFFNLADNSSTLDTENGGFTVFGSIVGDEGLQVMDTIAAQQVVNVGSPFDQLPVVDYTDGEPTASNLIFIDDVLHNYTVASSDTTVATVALNNSILTYTPVAPGTTTITVTAEALDGTTAEQTFNIDVGTSLTAKIGKGGQKSVNYVDGLGGAATVSLTGPGSATLQFSGDTAIAAAGKVPYNGDNLHLTQVTLTGTTAATTLHITPTNGGTLAVTSISSSGALAGIYGPTVSLTGDVTVGGSLGSLTVNATNPGSSLTATRVGTVKVLGNAFGDMTVAGTINKLTVGNYISGALTVGAINTLTANSLQQTNLDLTSAGTSLKTMRVDNAVQTTIVAKGNINSISLFGGVASTEIFAGISAATAASLPGAATAAAAAKGSINNLVVGGGPTGDAFSDSTVAAAVLRHVTTGNLDDSTASTAAFYGFAAAKILSFRGYVDEKTLTIANATTAALLQAQLTKHKITLTNLTIDIV